MSGTSQNSKELFSRRHIGPRQRDLEPMLSTIGADSLDQLIGETIPKSILLPKKITLPDHQTEPEFLEEMRSISKKNKVFKSYIGMGYYNTHTPGVILRNILENPGWYTQYTPYQSEISQGRLEALLNFQTLVMDLTGMEVANASLLDEGTSAAEAMFMCWNSTRRQRKPGNEGTFFISNKCFPQTIDILKTRAEPLGINIVVGELSEAEACTDLFGVLVQYPNGEGAISNYSEFFTTIHNLGALCVVAADLLSLTLLTPPSEFDADIVVGNTQRFGVPMAYGGPHAAYFATKNDFKRLVPGRIIGVSKDANGRPALRMALQTREQHIRREKATSNICTAQVLLAIMASMYAVYHGPSGLKSIAQKIHQLATNLSQELKKLGFHQSNNSFFDTLKIVFGANQESLIPALKQKALENGINFRYYPGESAVGISIDETTTPEDISAIIQIFSSVINKTPAPSQNGSPSLSLGSHERKSPFLTHFVFNQYHSETEMLRYIKRLESKDLSLNYSMIPLGSCTMKLNATSEMIPVTWPEFANIHPFVPLDQAQGYTELFARLENALMEITGFTGVSLQPNAGSQGEFAGLLVIREYHAHRKESHRNLLLIPSSAHGTNPASASLAGMDIIVVACDEMGNISLSDLEKKAIEHKDRLAGLMVTYPSTHGVFEEEIQAICKVIHDNGGLVYMDGANMNAQVGLCHPGSIGADVCHLNLHKTFCIPHGGGGPGMGPICVNDKLKDFLPGHPLIQTGGSKAIKAVSAAPWGSAGILVISQAYIAMMGEDGLTLSTKMAILNANYMLHRLKEHFPILYLGKKGRVAHEFILDFRPFKNSAHIEVIDVAKRLMDYGFHAPTVSFPVAGTMMIEPTESESKEELDRFCDALLQIRKEIEDIEEGRIKPEESPLVNAPHTQEMVISGEWNHPYTREEAVFPNEWVKGNKYWPSVARVDNTYGDKNLICSCLPLESYVENAVVRG